MCRHMQAFPALWSTRLSRVLVVLGLVVLLSACTMVTLAYNRLPTLVYWRVDGMFDLSADQSARLKPLIEDWHRWHRREHLPRYAQALRDWQALAVSDLTPGQVCATFDQVRGWALEAVERFMPLMVELAPTLSAAQIDHWDRHQAKQDASFAEDFGDAPGTVSDKRLKRAVDRAEMFYGPLDDAQRQWLRERLARSAFDPAMALGERRARHADALSVVARIQAGAVADQALRQWWGRTVDSPRPAYRAYTEAAVQDACAQFAELHNRTTPAQRSRAVQKLQSFERDFLALSNGQP